MLLLFDLTLHLCNLTVFGGGLKKFWKWGSQENISAVRKKKRMIGHYFLYPCCDSGLCSPHSVHSCYQSQTHVTTVGQSVFVSSPIWGSWPDINYYLKVTDLSMSGAPSDEGSGLSFLVLALAVHILVEICDFSPDCHSCYRTAYCLYMQAWHMIMGGKTQN
jgi:hypothetical protein